MEEKNKIENLIESSGIITHYKVIDILRNNGWDVAISPYYYDNISNTIKEIDVVAEKPIYSADAFERSSARIALQLFLECKYINHEIVFWFDRKDKIRAIKKLEDETGLQIVYRGHRNAGDTVPEKFHYFTDDKVVKLFSTNANKEDIIYKAITQCLNAKIYYNQWFNRPIGNKPIGYEKIPTQILRWPIIVCDNFNKLTEVKFDDNSQYTYQGLENFFQIETDYIYLDKTRTLAKQDYFLIDVVDFNYLKNFLDGIEKEAKLVIDAKI